VRSCLFLLIAGLLLAAPAAPAAERISGALRIYVLDVGQGDAILIICPARTHRMLIDTGARGYPGSQDAFHAQLSALLGTNRNIDVLVATHPHEDHIAGVEWVLSTFKVRKFIDSGKPYGSIFAGIERQVRVLRRQRPLRLERFKATAFPPPHVADFCSAANVSARLLIPNEFGADAKINNSSVAVLITYNDQKFLFTGDAEKKGEQRLLADPITSRHLADATVYKAGHHGAQTSSSDALLQVVRPKMAVVSSGCPDVARNRGYRHPRVEVLRALGDVVPARTSATRMAWAGLSDQATWMQTRLSDTVSVTSRDGVVLIESDGRRPPIVTYPELPGELARCDAPAANRIRKE
jgi:competence protein ComEC